MLRCEDRRTFQVRGSKVGLRSPMDISSTAMVPIVVTHPPDNSAPAVGTEVHLTVTVSQTIAPETPLKCGLVAYLRTVQRKICMLYCLNMPKLHASIAFAEKENAQSLLRGIVLRYLPLRSSSDNFIDSQATVTCAKSCNHHKLCSMSPNS